MKRKIIFIVWSLIIATTAQSQEVTVKSPSPDLKVEFKRCISGNDITFIDILITNTSGQSTKINCKTDIDIYDDEGNIYNNKNTTTGKYNVYIASSNTNNQPLKSMIEIPAGISHKARIIIADGFDKYATEVKLLKLNFSWDVFNTKTYGLWLIDSIELRNLPITRE